MSVFVGFYSGLSLINPLTKSFSFSEKNTGLEALIAPSWALFPNIPFFMSLGYRWHTPSFSFAIQGYKEVDCLTSHSTGFLLAFTFPVQLRLCDRVGFVLGLETHDTLYNKVSTSKGVLMYDRSSYMPFVRKVVGLQCFKHFKKHVFFVAIHYLFAPYKPMMQEQLVFQNGSIQGLRVDLAGISVDRLGYQLSMNTVRILVGCEFGR